MKGILFAHTLTQTGATRQTVTQFTIADSFIWHNNRLRSEVAVAQEKAARLRAESHSVRVELSMAWKLCRKTMGHN